LLYNFIASSATATVKMMLRGLSVILTLLLLSSIAAAKDRIGHCYFDVWNLYLNCPDCKGYV
jgi:hypothetical protein